MAKILFVQHELREQFGYMIMSAKLKKAGHKVDVTVSSDLKMGYDVYFFSSSTISYPKDLYFAKQIKLYYPKSYIVFGGAHPTYNSNIINEKCIDAVCVGEGINIVEQIVKERKKKIYQAKMISDINEWEFDYELYYDRYTELTNKPTKTFYFVRGCPYQCAFCYNPAFNRLYKKQKVLQCMDIKKAINIIKKVKNKWGMEYAQFISDNMTINKKWLFSFLKKYKKEIGTPFFLNCRANEVDQEIVSELKDAGCDRVDFGVEHGHSMLRNEILRRHMTDREIIECGKMFTLAGIRVQTTNIFGVPFEDFKMAWKTVKINREFVPEITKACILQPFKNTEVYNFARDLNLLKKINYSGTTRQAGVKDNRAEQTMIVIKHEKQIIRLSYLLDFFVKWFFIPRWLGWVICNIPFDILYKQWYNIIFAKHGKKYKGLK